MPFEVELRSFIPKEKYQELITFFTNNAQLIKEDEQVTYFLSGEKDLRIQRTKNYTKICLKAGKMHEQCRQETEVHMDRDQFLQLSQLFHNLGYTITMKGVRTRHKYLYKNCNITIDQIFGYAYMIECEKMVETQAQEAQALKEIKDIFAQLNLTPATTQESDQLLSAYKKDWYTKEIIKEKEQVFLSQ